MSLLSEEGAHFAPCCCHLTNPNCQLKEPFASQPPLMQNTCPYTSLQLPVTQEMTTKQLFQPVDSPIGTSLPIAPRNPRFAELPSSDINRAKLKSVHDVLQKYSTLRVESKIGILAVKLAREAIFGDDIPKQCTPEDGTTCQLFHRWS